MNKSLIRQFNKLFAITVFAAVFAKLQSIISINNLNELLANEQTVSFHHFLNYILVADEINKYDYLSKDDFILFFQPISFMIIGLFITSTNFLVKSKGCYCFEYYRYDNEKAFIRKLFLDDLSLIFVYCISFTFFVSMNGVLEFKDCEIFSLAGLLIWNCIQKIVFLICFKVVMLKIYIKKGFSISILHSSILLGVISLLDFMFENVCIIFFINQINPLVCVVEIIVAICIFFSIRNIDLMNL